MYTNILLPVAHGGTDALETPIEVALALAADGAKLTLLHVMEQLPNYVIEYLPPDSMAETKAAMQAKIDTVADGLPDARALVMEGHAGRVLSDFANDHGIDLVVMASHQPELSDVIFGSTAGYVVRHVGCAVHVVR